MTFDPGSIAAWVSAGLALLLVVERAVTRARGQTEGRLDRIEAKLAEVALALCRLTGQVEAVEGRLLIVEGALGGLHERFHQVSSDLTERVVALEVEVGLTSGAHARR